MVSGKREVGCISQDFPTKIWVVGQSAENLDEGMDIHLLDYSAYLQKVEEMASGIVSVQNQPLTYMCIWCQTNLQVQS